MTLSSDPPRDNQANQSGIPVIPKEQEEDAMTQTYTPSVDSVIYDEVNRLMSCSFDDLAQRLPVYSWAQVFAAVDRLSRQGTLRLSRTDGLGYVLSACSDPLLPGLREAGGPGRCVNGTADSILAGK